MRIFLTGATGFIGRTLLELLARQGETIHVMSRSPLSRDHDGASDIREFRGDILSLQDVLRAMEGCEVAFHLAGYARNWSRDSSVFHRVNVQGTATILEAARTLGLRRVVYTSSAMALGPSNGVPVTEVTVRTAPVLTDYERSKLAAEEHIRDSARAGLDTVIVLPTRVFGPGLLNEGNSATRMIQMYIEGRWRILPGDGSALGNYGFVHDIAEGHRLAMEFGRAGERYIIGGENLSYRQLFETVSHVAGIRRRMLRVPRALALGASRAEELRARVFRGYPSVTPGWASTFLTDSACSCDKAQRELGYRITSFADALHETITWLRARKDTQ